MTFATLVLFVKDKIHSKISLALMGIATVALSIGASFGLTLILQVPFTSLSQVQCLPNPPRSLFAVQALEPQQHLLESPCRGSTWLLHSWLLL